MGAPVALSTLFELPLDQFGAAASPDAAGVQELTATALQQLSLGAAGAATQEAAAAAPPPSGPTCIACGIGVGGAAGFASAEQQRRHFSLVRLCRALGAGRVRELARFRLQPRAPLVAAPSAASAGLAPLQREAARGGAAACERGRLQRPGGGRAGRGGPLPWSVTRSCCPPASVRTECTCCLLPCPTDRQICSEARSADVGCAPGGLHLRLRVGGQRGRGRGQQRQRRSSRAAVCLLRVR